MFDRSAVLKLLAANVLGLAFIYARFSTTERGNMFNLSVQAWFSRFIPGTHPNCGLLKWNDYYIVSDRVLLEDGSLTPAAVHIVRGKITSISHAEDVHGSKVLSFRDAIIMPGAIDVHIHLNEPGREEWEGIGSGTRAAALGGVTTVIDMPLNSFPVTTTVEQLKRKVALARKKAVVNIGYWAGLVPENAADHKTLGALVQAGAAGFKSFMCPSGINDFGHVTADDIAAALPFLKQAGVPFFVHAEVVSDVPPPEGDPTVYATYMHTRPPKFEQDAIKLLVELLDKDTTPAAPGFSVHIAHLADAGALPIIKEAQQRHPITVETCAHYLTFHDTMVPDNATWFKCAPPIRDASNQAALTKAVLDGDIVLVSSDHSPAPPDMKQLDTGNFLRAWGGISGAQYLLPATWTAIRQYGGDVHKLVSLLSTEPAKLAGLSGRKGKVAVGYDADLVVFDPEGDANTGKANNHHRHKITPYEDLPLKGQVKATIVNGHFVSLFGRMGREACGLPVQDLK